MTAKVTATIAVRAIVPRERHPLSFGSFGKLRPGEAFLLVNDHDPKPLYYHFKAELAGNLCNFKICRKHDDTLRNCRLRHCIEHIRQHCARKSGARSRIKSGRKPLFGVLKILNRE